jgi:two-component system cell cycle response regulator DivK
MTEQEQEATAKKMMTEPHTTMENQMTMTTEHNGPLVLVVDDFVDNREMYSEYLQFSGYRVIEATNGREAVEAATAQLPDIIIMDLSLPVMDGWEATRRLKSNARTASIPVVALTGHALAGHSKGARDAGCDSFLIKPCLPDQLVVEIKRMLSDGTLTISRTRKG